MKLCSSNVTTIDLIFQAITKDKPLPPYFQNDMKAAYWVAETNLQIAAKYNDTPEMMKWAKIVNKCKGLK